MMLTHQAQVFSFIVNLLVLLCYIDVFKGTKDPSDIYGTDKSGNIISMLFILFIYLFIYLFCIIEAIKLDYDKLQQYVKVEPTMETDELDMLKIRQHRQGVMTKDKAVQFSYLQTVSGTITLYHCNGM